MASFNKVMLMGNLTRIPELRYTPNGQAVCDLGLATNRKYSVNGQDKEEVCFIDIVVWGKQAESCGKYLQKGSPVFVEGRLHYDAWDDKDGKKRSRLRVTAERVQFLSSRGDDSRQSNRVDDNHQQSAHTNQGGQSGEAQFSGHNTNQRVQERQTANRSESMPPPPPSVFDNDEPEDDIPF